MGRGWINKELYEHETGSATLRGHGLWQNLEAQDLALHKGLVVTTDATPTTYDVHSQGWVFAICIHTISLGQLKRLAAITGLPPGKQSKAPALYYGVRVLAQHVQQKVNLVIPSIAVWEAWTDRKTHRPFVDLDALHDPNQKGKVIALYVSPKVRTS